MQKKFLSILIINMIIMNCFTIVYADNIDSEEIDINNIIQTASNNVDENININSRIAIAYDRDSNMVIWGKNENKKTAMASTTKIMTSIIVAEKSNLSDIVTISSKAAGTGGSRLGLKQGDKITMKDLLYGLMLRSGNDAAVAIAEYIAGDVKSFAELMNDKAKDLGLESTHFVTPHGLDDPNHYTTAYELAKIADYALENEIISKVVASKQYTININGYPKDLTNTNELLGVLPGVNGVKTGFTNNAGRCLVTSVKKDNLNIITVVIQADTKKDRTKDSIDIINYIYENYKKVNIKEIANDEFKKWCNINKERICVEKAKKNVANLKLQEFKNDIIVVRKNDLDNIKFQINAIYNYSAPVKNDTVVGNLKIVINDDVIESKEIYLDNYIAKKDILDYICQYLKAYKSLNK